MKRGGIHMARDSFDDKISGALKRGTKQSSEALHEENFRSILQEINDIDKGEKRMPKRKSALGKIVSIGTIAAIMLITLVTFTQPGQAALEKIKKYFEPEKKVENEIEGNKEVIDSRLQQSEMGYVIYYDQERYKIVQDGDVDRIVMKETYENIPEVYMEISQDKDKTPEELAGKLEEELKAGFSNVDPAQNVTDPVKGIYIHAINGGTKWDDEIVNYYLVDNTKGGTFIIKQKYFLEASEGHGTRFYNMLKEFVIVEEEPAE
jgi:hypothetical protein